MYRFLYSSDSSLHLSGAFQNGSLPEKSAGIPESEIFPEKWVQKRNLQNASA